MKPPPRIHESGSIRVVVIDPSMMPRDVLEVRTAQTPQGEEYTLVPRPRLGVGRNARCPCGSGKKFKVCGLRGKCPPQRG